MWLLLALPLHLAQSELKQEAYLGLGTQASALSEQLVAAVGPFDLGVAGLAVGMATGVGLGVVGGAALLLSRSPPDQCKEYP